MRVKTKMLTDTVCIRETDESADALFWAECRRKATELNIPAWKLAEEMYTHRDLDVWTSSR
jgi:hypothetical protein